MANNLGNKHLCEECGAKFYDFGKSEITCPKCGTEVLEETKKKPATRKAPKKKPAALDKKPQDDLDEDVADGGEDDEDKDDKDDEDDEDEDEDEDEDNKDDEGLVGEGIDDEDGDQDEDEDDEDKDDED